MKITYILPIHKKDPRLTEATNSIPEDAEIVIVVPQALEDEIEHTVVCGGHSYPALANAGIAYTLEHLPDTEYINILEQDDYLQENAHDNLEMYAADWDADILAPLCYMVTKDDDKVVLRDFGNKAIYNADIPEEEGLFDMNMLLKQNFLFVNGCYIKPEVFKEHGLFKESFKYYYDYEWQLRVLYGGAIVRGVPKATHVHLLEGEATTAHKALSQEESVKWIAKCRGEYFFEDREVTV